MALLDIFKKDIEKVRKLVTPERVKTAKKMEDLLSGAGAIRVLMILDAATHILKREKLSVPLRAAVISELADLPQPTTKKVLDTLVERGLAKEVTTAFKEPREEKGVVYQLTPFGKDFVSSTFEFDYFYEVIDLSKRVMEKHKK